MDLNSPEAKAFLFELYTATQGDPEVQVSMYDVGDTLGLEQSEAGTMAEALFIQGLAELKTLSGGIGITLQGLKALDVKLDPKLDDSQKLGPDPILDDQGKEAVENIILDIQTCIITAKQSYPQLEEMVIDIKTIEIQLLSPRPKTEIIREILRSLQSSLTDSGSTDLAEKVTTFIMS